MKKILQVVTIVFSLSLIAYGQAEKADKDVSIPGPSFEDVLGLKSVGRPEISPCGKHILFTIRQVDWEKNRYDTEIWLSRDGAEPFQLTQTLDESSDSPSWSPDGRWVAFLAKRDGKTNQIYLINPVGGEAFKLTNHKEGINSYEWCPLGKSIAFTSTEPESKESKAREKQYGKFEVEDAEYKMTHLWIIDVEPGKIAEAKRLTSGADFTVRGFAWSPDGKKIAFDHRPDPLINSGPKSDISILDVESGKITPLVAQPGSDRGPLWSPDGQWIAFSTSMGDDRYYVNGKIAKIPADGGPITVLTSTFDEDPRMLKWTNAGIAFVGNEKVFSRIYLLDPAKGNYTRIASTPENIYEASFAGDGNAVAFSGFDRTTLTEIYRANLDSWEPQAVTKMTEQVAGWKTGTREVIEWKSKDGTLIEGVLWKPEGFEPGRKYPLLVIIHGGPGSISIPVLVSPYVYPYLEWLSKGALILEPNYRGSGGYGGKFLSLNVRNLGVGDLWDVESGVDSLIAKGLVDPDRVGAMGWSQGGYISAFLATNSTKFKAISVGAGISNWVTYYVNTDIHPFTRHYLQATPWDDMEIYRKTSPMTNIKKAQTPTLIQHGENDRRVPIPNAYELFQGLQDMGVPTKLIIYKEFGHGISRPKEQLAATWHNWQWFARHIWNEDVVIPIEVEEEKEKDDK
ncbi:MAG TPA: S9 family peptidase [Candidatus Desulfaltia sp.]|nr:S9 family peptidase [Candidatus Desulfaltia sp.]